MQWASETETIYMGCSLLCLEGGPYCLPQMLASAKCIFTILVFLVQLPACSSYDQGMTAMGGADQEQGDAMKLTSKNPSSATVQR